MASHQQEQQRSTCIPQPLLGVQGGVAAHADMLIKPSSHALRAWPSRTQPPASPPRNSPECDHLGGHRLYWNPIGSGKAKIR